MKVLVKQKVVDYNVYVAKDGTEFESEQACIDHEKILDGTRKVCPQCGGKRYVNERVEKYFDGGRYGDHQYHSRIESDVCPTCNGKGYLEKKVTWE